MKHEDGRAEAGPAARASPPPVCCPMPAAVSDSGEALRCVLEWARDAHFVADGEGRYVYANGAACELLGYSLPELLELRMSDLLPESELPRLAEHLAQLGGGGPGLSEWQLRRKDGALVTVELSAQPLAGGLHLAVARDIGERKRLETELSAAEARWKFALEGAGHGVWDWDVPNGRVYFSPVWKRMLGYTEDEIGDSLAEWSERVHPDDRDRCGADLEAHFAGRTPDYVNEHRVRCKDGGYKWVLDRGRVLEWQPDGSPRRMVGTHTDITDRHRQEDERSRELELFTRGPVVVFKWRLEPGWPVDYVSANAVTVLGYPAADFVSGRVAFADLVHPDDRQRLIDEVKAATRQGPCSREHLPYRLRHGDGSEHWLFGSTSVVHDELGQVSRVFGYVLDMTDYLSLQDSLSERKAQLRTLIETLPDAVILKDGEGRWQVANAAAARTFGLDGLDWRGMDEAALGRVRPDIAWLYGRCAATDLQVWEAGHALRYEETLPGPDGGTSHLDVSKVPLYHPDGARRGLLVVVRDVTAARLASLELARERARLRALIDSIPDLIFFKDANSVYLGCNKAFEAYSGVPEAELIGRTDRDFVAPELADFYQAMDRAMLEAGETRRNEEWIPFRDGGGGLFDTVKTPFRGPDGALLGVIGISRDITEKKALEEALRQRERYQRAVLDNFPFMVWLKDTESRFLAVNRPFARACGVEDPQFLAGKTDLDVWPRQLAERYRADDAEVLAGRRKKSVEEPVDVGGEQHWFETYKAPVEDADGHLLGTVGFARDISGRKQVEEALRRERSLLRALIDAIPDPIFFKDLELRYLRCNRATAAVFGRSEDEIVGRSDLDLVPAETAEAFRRRDRIALRSGTIYRHEEVVRYPDGREVLLDTLKFPFLGAGGELLGLIGVARDITERKRVEEQARAALARFEALFRHSPNVAIQGFGPDGTVIHWNPASELLFGYTDREACGRRIQDLLWAGEVNGPFERGVAALWDGSRNALAGEWPVRDRQGRRIWVLSSMFPVRESGRVVEIFRMDVDVTERRRAEQQLQLAASVFAHAHEGILITDTDGRMLDVNQTACDITGYARGELIGANPRLLQSGHQDARFYAELWRTLSAEGHWRGELWNRRKDGRLYAQQTSISAVRDESGTVSHYVGLFSDVTALKESQKRLEHLAYYDALTHLPNRLLLADRMRLSIATAQRKGELLAVCYLDLDGFKPVNDNWGHATGDRLLIEVAQRLTETVRGADTVSRLGGDEFVVLLGGLSSREECEHAVGRLLEALARPFFLPQGQVGVSASVGVTLYPGDSADPDVLIRHADQAMYVAKQEGRNRHHLFDPEHDRSARRHSESVTRIGTALAAGQFELHYQPKISAREGAVVGVEALLRWRHPERGLLLPAEFLPPVVDSEVVVALTDWVIARALEQLCAWRAAGLDLPVSVNVPARYLQLPDFTGRLGAVLAGHPELGPGHLVLEILETVALDDMAHVSAIIESCAALGVEFSLDDFGTGYSSLTYLKHLPARELKIDRSFIRDMLEDPEDMAIVEGVIGLAGAFQRRVVAEGVESVGGAVLLAQLGCDRLQGDVIAAPMDGALIPAWVAAWSLPEEWAAATRLRWSRDDLPMLMVEFDHRLWVEGVAAALRSGGAAPPDFGSHLDCRFGHWLEGSGRERYGQWPEFAAVVASHRAVHELGADLAGAWTPGAACPDGRLAQLMAGRDRLLAHLRQLQSRALRDSPRRDG